MISMPIDRRTYSYYGDTAHFHLGDRRGRYGASPLTITYLVSDHGYFRHNYWKS